MIKPSIKSCQKIKDDFQVIPISKELYADHITPVALLNALNKLSYCTFLLESVAEEEQWGRYSFLGFNPVKTIECKNGMVTDNGILVHEEPLEYIRKELREYKAPSFSYLPSFTGGFVGFFSYDAITYFEPAVSGKAIDTLQMPDIRLMLFDKIICFDHFSQTITIMIHVKTNDLEENYQQAKMECEAIERMIKDGQPLSIEPATIGDISSNMSKEEYKQKVEKLKEYIYNGDIFQGVLAQRFQVPFHGNFFHVYRVLRRTNPSPYMYFLNFGDIEIAGTSPETLVKVVDGTIYSRPIAGTRKRGKNPQEDEVQIENLLKDEKELSEHNMLVDLARNDLGKISIFDSVEVSEYLKINKFSHVIHLTSLVTGKLAPKYDSLAVLEATFPAGTLSGAPKIKAMNILDELEGEKRGIYGGAIGYIDFNGNLDMCIAIRTMVKKEDTVFIGAGAGIVYDSVPEKEYEETLDKAAAMFQALQQSTIAEP